MKKRLSGILTLLLAFMVQVSFAQEKTVTGTVTDEGGLPLPGVNIVVQGTNTGAQTDFDGNYSIQAEQGDMLVFSYVGFETAEFVVSDVSRIDVTLTEDTAELEEVVVMGYVSKRKDDMTGSVVSIGSESLEQTTTVSVDQALQGKVAGLNVSTGSGTPGSTADIRIRGRSSLTAGNEPLYVIDGVPMTGGNMAGASSGSSLSALSSLNNSDIKSITVLKDASATASYGARGANGVIVITTKGGQAGRTTINVSSSYGWANDAIEGPQVLTGAEREMLWYEAVYNDYGEANGFTRDEAQEFSNANFGIYNNWIDAGRPETDWQDHITNEDAPMQEHNISATGGGEDHTFYTSLGYYDQEATVIGSEFERISGALNFSKDISDNFTFSTSNTASHTFQDGLLEGSAYFSSPRTAKFFLPPITPAFNEDGSVNLNTPMPNPLWIAEEDIDQNRLTRILSNNSLRWNTPIENLDFGSRFSVDYKVANFKRYRNRISGDGASINGSAWQTHRSVTTYVFQNFLDYTIQSGDHGLDLQVLQEFQKNRDYYLEAYGTEMATDNLTNLGVAGVANDVFSAFEDWAVASYMANASYSFDNRYVLNGTYRKEGNSRFGQDTRWGDFWSVGGAWNLHREGFLAGNDDINTLKLRASYGVTGNANIDLNQYQVLYGYSADYGGTAAAFPSQYGNENLTWETNNTFDMGIDFAFMQNRINGTVGYYTRETEDMLLEVPLSLTTGFGDQTINVGRMRNSGFEAELEYSIVRSDDFNFSIGGNIATNENEVLELAKDATGQEINITETATRVESGHPAYGWYLPTWAGVDPETGVDTWYTDGVGSEITTNFNAAEKDWQGGSALPTLTGGLTLHLDFKGFFLDASGFYQGGHKVYESWHLYTHQGNAYSLRSFQGINTVLDRWQEPGDITRHRKVTTAYQPWQYNSKFLFDGDFARLRNLTVGYSLSDQIAEAVGVVSGRVYVRGTNLATWVKDDNLVWDPEVNASGFTNMYTPPTKTVVLGVNFKL